MGSEVDPTMSREFPTWSEPERLRVHLSLALVTVSEHVYGPKSPTITLKKKSMSGPHPRASDCAGQDKQEHQFLESNLSLQSLGRLVEISLPFHSHFPPTPLLPESHHPSM